MSGAPQTNGAPPPTVTSYAPCTMSAGTTSCAALSESCSSGPGRTVAAAPPTLGSGAMVAPLAVERFAPEGARQALAVEGRDQMR